MIFVYFITAKGRVKKAMNARKKHKKILKLAKGFRGSRSKLYRPANTFVMKALK
ncbi:50S ribosomal protein L20, partial [Clostridioides difficile]